MADARSIFRHLHLLFGRQHSVPLPDQELLQRFACHRDEAAFAALVQRHGPLVLGVCRRILRSEQDAEDVFQATFLLLAQKAASIRFHQALGSWLHKVAYHIALQARTRSLKRQTCEQQVKALKLEATDVEDTGPDWQRVLDEELHRLPEKYRAGLILCYLSGKSRDEAAQQLGWPLGTLKSRLERGRELLRLRLTQRGVTLSAALGATAVAVDTLAAAVPAPLHAAAVNIAMLITEGQAASVVASASIATLSEGAWKAMTLGKLKMMLAVILLVGMTAAGGVAIAFYSWVGPDRKATPEGAKEPPAGPGIDKARGKAGGLDKPAAPTVADIQKKYSEYPSKVLKIGEPIEVKSVAYFKDGGSFAWHLVGADGKEYFFRTYQDPGGTIYHSDGPPKEKGRPLEEGGEEQKELYGVWLRWIHKNIPNAKAFLANKELPQTKLDASSLTLSFEALERRIVTVAEKAAYRD